MPTETHKYVSKYTDAEKTERKARLVECNKTIAKHADRKELSEAVSIFHYLKSQGLTNSHTYASMLNVHVRCGDIIGAHEIFEELKAKKSIKLDVVACTTMMKGYSGNCDINNAKKLLATMIASKPPVLPNIRTVNTFLRGCVMAGAIVEADQVVYRMKKDYQVTADVSTHEYLITLLCQGLMLDKVYPMVGRIKNDPLLQSGIDAIQVSIGRAAAMLGDWKQAKKACQAAEEVLNHNNAGDGDERCLPPHEDVEGDDDGKGSAGGGKRAWKAISDDSRAESLRMFRQHRGGELQREIQCIKEFIAAREGLKGKHELKGHYEYMLLFYRKALSLVGLENGPAGDARELPIRDRVISTLLDAIKAKFGFGELMKRAATRQCEAASSRKEGPSKAEGGGDGATAAAGDVRGASAISNDKAVSCGNEAVDSSTANTHGASAGLDSSMESKERKYSTRRKKKRGTKAGIDIGALGDVGSTSIGPAGSTDEGSSRGVVCSGSDTATQEGGGKKVNSQNKAGDEAAPSAPQKDLDNTSGIVGAKAQFVTGAAIESSTSLKDPPQEEGELLSGRLFAEVEAFISSSVGDDGTIDFSTLFGDLSSSSTTLSYSSSLVSSTSTSNTSMISATTPSASASASAKQGSSSSPRAIVPSTAPLKVEVCSGAGEWVVAQAQSDLLSNWVALELRHDRVYQTFTRAVWAGAHNVCVMGGDAMRILPAHFATASVSVLCVNHPEPPQQTGGQNSEGKHLLSEAFFHEAARILKPDGVITIVTDNQWYGRLLMRMLNAMPQPHPLSSLCPRSVHDLGWAGEWALSDSAGGISLFVGKPGPECGHMVDASSYFDRLWKRSSLHERYFLVLRKQVVVRGVALPEDPVAAAKARKRGVLVNAGVTNNKKIKFGEEE